MALGRLANICKLGVRYKFCVSREALAIVRFFYVNPAATFDDLANYLDLTFIIGSKGGQVCTL